MTDIAEKQLHISLRKKLVPASLNSQILLSAFVSKSVLIKKA
jgi:hypothetical protein